MVDIGDRPVIGAAGAGDGLIIKPVIKVVPDHDVAGQRVLLVNR